MGRPNKPGSEGWGRESRIHERFIAALKTYGSRCYYVHSRTDKASTVAGGTPDFIGWLDGIPWAVEFKVPGRKASVKQSGELLRAELAGAHVAVCYSSEQAFDFVNALTTKNQ